MKKMYGVLCVVGLLLLGTSSNANAALIIDFDNVSFDGGTLLPLGGNNFSGVNIVFDTILLKDTTAGTTLAGVQCGVATSVGAALASDTCKLNFNTAANTFTVTSPTGLWGIGADNLPYTADRGGLVAGTAGLPVLTGSFTNFANVTGLTNSLFAATGPDSKNPALLAFFGLAPGTTFTFANTDIWTNANGQVTEADLVNQVNEVVPEPASMTLLGLGLLAVAYRARRKLA